MKLKISYIAYQVLGIKLHNKHILEGYTQINILNNTQKFTMTNIPHQEQLKIKYSLLVLKAFIENNNL